LIDISTVATRYLLAGATLLLLSSPQTSPALAVADLPPAHSLAHIPSNATIRAVSGTTTLESGAIAWPVDVLAVQNLDAATVLVGYDLQDLVALAGLWQEFWPN